MTPRLGLIADDLTGAIEVGAACRQAGMRSLVLPLPGAPVPAVGAEAIVINTDSRHLRPDIAAERARRAAISLLAVGCRQLYKKVDSTLRGNIGAECRAIAALIPGERVLYAPAFPEAGRTVVDGVLLVDGVPVAETAFATDPLCPVACSRVAEQIGGGAGFQIVDAASDADLARIAQIQSRRRLYAGPAGLLRALLPVLTSTPEPVPCWRPDERPWLVLVGSQHPASLQQAAALVNSGAEQLRLQPSDCFQNDSMPVSWHERAESAWSAGRPVVLQTAICPADVAEYSQAARLAGLDATSASACLTARIASCAAALLAPHPEVGVLICGGATAQAVAEGWALMCIRPLRELAPGLAWARAYSALGERDIISKNGGFGGPELLVDVLRQGVITCA